MRYIIDYSRYVHGISSVFEGNDIKWFKLVKICMANSAVNTNSVFTRIHKNMK